LNGSGRAPRLASRSEYVRRGLTGMPIRGPLSVTVLGAVHAWKSAIERFGSWPLASLLQPAIDAAAGGVEVTERLASWVERDRSVLALDASLLKWVFDDGGDPVLAGARIVRRQLAETLSRIPT